MLTEGRHAATCRHNLKPPDFFLAGIAGGCGDLSVGKPARSGRQRDRRGGRTLPADTRTPRKPGVRSPSPASAPAWLAPTPGLRVLRVLRVSLRPVLPHVTRQTALLARRKGEDTRNTRNTRRRDGREPPWSLRSHLPSANRQWWRRGRAPAAPAWQLPELDSRPVDRGGSTLAVR